MECVIQSFACLCIFFTIEIIIINYILQQEVKILKRDFKPLMQFILYRLLSIFSILIPKNRKMIIFLSLPHFSDNSRYLYERAKGLLGQYHFIWVVKDIKRFESLDDDSTTFVQHRSLEYLKFILRAKYVVHSVGMPYWKSRNQIGIQLWHGIPLKIIGKKEPISKEIVGHKLVRTKSMKQTDYFISTSHLVSYILSSSFDIPIEKFISLGYPRCDALFSSEKKSKDVLSEMLSVDVSKYAKIVMYLPTFRNNEYYIKIINQTLHNKKFREFIEENGVLFILKPHILDEELIKKYDMKNIKIIKNSDIMNRFLTIYDILPSVDILVTDYSSVYFDYLLLNRPIVFYAPDLEAYEKSRGFILTPYERWTPGDKASTVEELIAALKEAIDKPDKWKKEREWIRDIMFEYQDGESSERIVRYFWGDK